jgi:phosphoribosylglycinamide formyltransferase-1
MNAVAQSNVAVLASGKGSNLQALIDSKGGKIDLLVCNVPGAACLDRAKKAGIEAVVVDHHEYLSREAYDQALIALLQARKIEVVVLAGFMRLLTPAFLAAFQHRVINVHPALLPAFPGMHAVKQAIDYGVKVTGCTVHFVDDGIDTGPIIAQAIVPVRDGDDEETLQQRIHVEEHLLFPKVVWQVARGDVSVSGRKVSIKEGAR